jgi:hypothetical protein
VQWRRAKQSRLRLRLFREEQRNYHEIEENGCAFGAQAAERLTSQTMKFRDKGEQGTGEQKIAKGLRHGVGLAYEVKRSGLARPRTNHSTFAS